MQTEKKTYRQPGKRLKSVITAGKEFHHNLFDHMAEGYAYCQVILEDGVAKDWIYLAVNSAFEQLTGLKGAAGKRVSELIPGIREVDPELFAIYERVALTGEAKKFELFLESLQMWFSVSAYSPKRGFFVAVFEVINERKRAETALRDSEERFRAIFEQAAVGVAQIISSTGEFVLINQKYCDIVGYSREEMTGKTFQEITHPDDLAADLENMSLLLAGETLTFSMEKRYFRKDGRIVWVNLTVSPMWGLDEEPDYHIAVVEDITAHKEAEEALQLERDRVRQYFDAAAVLMMVLNPAGQIVQLNRKGYETLGYSEDELIGRNWIQVCLPEQDQAKLSQLFDQQFSEQLEMVEEIENVVVTRSGQEKMIRWYNTLLRSADGKIGGILCSGEDITKYKRAGEELRKALAEKETLLRELYHRTKNNMQVISALLDLQSEYMNDERLREVFVDTENRIRSMALVHQKLYEAQDLSHVNLKEYIGDLFQLLMVSYKIQPGSVSVLTEMEDVMVLIDIAIPCGLILNELISNAFKYAFPNGRTGEVTIRLGRAVDGEIQLRVADNGIGLPPGFDVRKDGRLGMQNIFILVEKQLKGQVAFETQGGLACQVYFRDNLYQPRV